MQKQLAAIMVVFNQKLGQIAPLLSFWMTIPTMTEIVEFAPAKLNLTLHITGRRPDGFHALDSLVAFANVGDLVRVTAAEIFSFHIKGPYGPALAHEPSTSNLAVKAAEALAGLTGNALKARIVLEKNLPIASGIGGGSSDATATLRALARLWGVALDDPRLLAAAKPLGDDVPYCLDPKPLFITPLGVKPAPALPSCPIVLVNPNQPLATASVYQEYRRGGDAFSTARPLPSLTDSSSLIAFLKNYGRNDLLAPACRLMPEISTILRTLEETEDCLLAQMSGSGATCFGFYSDESQAEEAAAKIKHQYPNWWVKAAILG